MHELAARVERHYKFSKSEIFRLSMTALVAAFCLTIYPGWGWFNLLEDNSLISYFTNLVLALCFFWLALWFHITAQKIVSLKLGYKAEYAYWRAGFIVSVILSFMTFGFLPVFFTGSIRLAVEEKLRMSRFRSGIMHKDIGVISFAGPMASMAVAAILSALYVWTHNPLLFALIVANLLVALYSLIPLPTFESARNMEGGTTGLCLFISSRWVYILAVVTVFVYAMLILVAQIFSIAIAFLIGGVTAFLYYRAYELK